MVDPNECFIHDANREKAELKEKDKAKKEQKDYNPYKNVGWCSQDLSEENKKLDQQIVNWFSITGLQAKAANEFSKDHVKCQRGAIGGAIVYKFCSTSLGQIFSAKCDGCGAEANFTDFWSW